MVEHRFSRIVVIMVKAPISGLVKTRLANRIGSVEAVRFYRSVMRDIVNRISRDRRWRTILAVAPHDYLRARFWPMELNRMYQGNGDLGRRLQRVFDLRIRGPMLIIGSDVPGINARHIADAFTLLNKNDVVFGPAEDGGYWLVGLKRRPSIPRIFSEVRWSTKHALADTRANVKGTVGLVAQLADVDTENDWQRWRSRD